MSLGIRLPPICDSSFKDTMSTSKFVVLIAKSAVISVEVPHLIVLVRKTMYATAAWVVTVKIAMPLLNSVRTAKDTTMRIVCLY